MRTLTKNIFKVKNEDVISKIDNHLAVIVDFGSTARP